MFVLACLMIGSLSGPAGAAPPKPSRITLNATAKNLAVGEKFTARVKSVTPARASRKVRWVSSRKSVATVSGKGVVKAVAAGTATITARSVVRPAVKRSIRVTVRKAAVVIDPKLFGSWGLFTTGAGAIRTFSSDGTWTSVVRFEAPVGPLQVSSKGVYQARNGTLHLSRVVTRSREYDDDPWGAWKPAEDRIENYSVGTDEYGEYLATEDYPDPVTPESVKYRRSDG